LYKVCILSIFVTIPEAMGTLTPDISYKSKRQLLEKLSAVSCSSCPKLVMGHFPWLLYKLESKPEVLRDLHREGSDLQPPLSEPVEPLRTTQ
jgi:hypothetical protein